MQTVGILVKRIGDAHTHTHTRTHTPPPTGQLIRVVAELFVCVVSHGERRGGGEGGSKGMEFTHSAV